MANKPRKHLVIPDTQIKPGVSLDHIEWIAKYATEKTPDVIVIIGDWADMPSLSSYDVGKKAFEGRKYVADIEVANKALALLMGPIEAEIRRRVELHCKRWNPELHVTLGNHEERIMRAINEDRKLEGLIHPADIRFKEFGWTVHPFLKPVVIDGVAYCHYFTSGVMDRPITTARALLNKQHMSCFAGHLQDRDIAYGKRADGTRITGIICGACYQHDEDYMSPQGNKVWRGVYMLNEVQDGSLDEMPVSLSFLKERYGKTEKEQA